MRIKYPKKLERILFNTLKKEYSYINKENLYLNITSLEYDFDFCIVKGNYGLFFEDDISKNKHFNFSLFLDYKFNSEYIKGMFVQKIVDIDMEEEDE